MKHLLSFFDALRFYHPRFFRKKLHFRKRGRIDAFPSEGHLKSFRPAPGSGSLGPQAERRVRDPCLSDLGDGNFRCPVSMPDGAMRDERRRMREGHRALRPAGPAGAASRGHCPVSERTGAFRMAKPKSAQRRNEGAEYGINTGAGQRKNKKRPTPSKF